MLEEELAIHVVKELETIGFVVYKEVPIKGGGSRRVDIYAAGYKDGEVVKTMAVETKMVFNLKVIEQAFHWKQNANTAWVAVPTARGNRFGVKVCRAMGIGVIEVDKKGDCFITVDAEVNNSPAIPVLYPEHIESVAGNANGEFKTPFSITVSRLKGILEKGDATVLDAITRSGHHYKTPRSAINSITKYIEAGVIEGIELYTAGGKRMMRLKKDDTEGIS